MFAMYEALYHSEPTPSQALRLITRHRVSLTQVMPASYKQRIKQVPGVAALYTSMWFGGTYKDDRDQRNFFARFAVEPKDFFEVQRDLKMPEEQKQAFLRERTACIVGRTLAQKFDFKLGDRIVLKGDIFPGNYELTVRGIYDSVDDTETLFFNLDYLYQSLPVARRDFAGTFNILVASKEQTGEVARNVDEMFKNAPVQTRTETEQAFLLSFVGFLGNVKAIVFAICAAVTFTILLVSANTMAMSVRERVREVGIMKTLGFTQGALLGILLGEAMAISLMGAALGCVLASVVAGGVGAAAGSFATQLRDLGLTPITTALTLAIGALVGLLAAIVPAWNASRTPILDTMRYTG
jgi:putative ABC transport system permease protein